MDTVRKLCTIQKIDEILPAENSDNLELAKVLGWQAVVKKGEFKVGDLVIYAEIDSIFPVKPEYEFLEKNHYRIRTIKLRGNLSQGLVLPISQLGNVPDCDISNWNYDTIGLDVTEMLGVTKFEPKLPIEISGQAIGAFPYFIPKTDEIRVQSAPELLAEMQGQEYYITEKLDGTSVTYFIKDGNFGVCSRNYQLKETETSIHWQIAKKYDLQNRLLPIREYNIAIQGEIIGPGIQKNPLGLTEIELFIYNTFDITKQVYGGLKSLYDFSDLFKIKFVPTVEFGISFNFTMDEIIELAKRNSILNGNVQAEGIVVRTVHNIYGQTPRKMLSFKCLNNENLLKKGE